MSWQSWIGRAALVSVALIAACNDNNSNNNNNGGTPDGATSCTPGLKECVTTNVARVCQSDGHWAAIKCIGGTCTAGDCVEDEPPAEQICLPGEGACQNATMALTCNDTGTAYTAKACPSGTTCVGPGLCQGTCVIGEGFCYDLTHTATCTDGKQFTTTACAGTTLCVASDNGVLDTAVCKASDCTPDPNGCGAVCGDKVNPSNDPTKSVSRCVETPAGYKWQVLPCPAPYTCSPGSSQCASGGGEAACSVDCVEGSKRCATATSIETCTNGMWANAIECNDPTSGGTSTCVPKNGDPLNVQCGDVQCQNGVGACTPDGKFLPCDANGKLNREAVTCTTGVCVADSASTTGTTEPAGRCATLCTESEGRCNFVSSMELSTSGQRCKNGRWEEQVVCTGDGETCWEHVVAGVNTIGCFVDCFPGTSMCDGDNTSVTCGDDGFFGDPVACTTGVCVDNADFTAASCQVECLSGQVKCGSNDLSDGYPRVSSEVITCGTDGRWGDPVACEGELTCRYDISGLSLGCVQCAGQSEVGQPDTRCTENNEVQTCKPDNTWGTLLMCGGAASCVDPETAEHSAAPYCQDPFFSEFILNFFGTSCAGQGLGAPISCPEFDGSPVPDCCSGACLADPPPAPAYCAANN